ncbi:hypothetical protein DVH24_002167 [Malus domestica]|uniref:Uncharacterized protein n=1 Tax=Malus domestica TaxID=3750 RepID=A0A498I6Y9_MALDO|nr:hypothetical protein DVH24_002167 [Malus domestica]
MTILVPQDKEFDLDMDTIISCKSWSAYNLGIGMHRKPLPSMDQIWETLTKINTTVERLQKNQTVAQAESHSNFMDMERWIKT